MKIVFDEPKRQKNLAGRGFDFAALTEEFFYEATIYPAKKGRFMAIGLFEGRMTAVVFARLGTEAISIISMRRASRKEGKGL
jgi:uncharacterized protein